MQLFAGRRAVRRLAIPALLGAAALATAAPAGAAVLSCGDPIAADTTLENDLVGCSGDALRIVADNVTLDLNGHTISGGPGATAGVRAAQRVGVEIKNGTIENSGEGVVLDHTTGSRVRGLTLLGNVRGINLAISHGNTIERNVARGSALDGIRLGISFGNVIAHNHIEGNVFSISLADNSSHNRIVRNSVVGNREGIALFSGGTDNVVERNVANDNQVDGIRVQSGVLETVLERNVANNNGDDGIQVDPPSGVLTRNVANANGDLGFELTPGVTDGGGNRARSNANPAQCTAISC